MRYAMVNGERREAEKGLQGECPGCGSPMIARCGEVKIHHWSHRTERNCDPWWDNESPWHRAWKNQFPSEWQEQVHYAADGEKHIADVKTDQGWVLEFQYSYLNPEERRERIAFYKKLVWIVCGHRRKTDIPQFNEALKAATPIGTGQILKVRSDECRLLTEWSKSPAPVFFDFNEEERLWWLLPNCADGFSYLGPFPRIQFLHLHRGGQAMAETFEKLLVDFPSLISAYNAPRARSNPVSRPLGRRHFRF